MIRNFFWLTDIQFGKLKPNLPTDTRGRPRVDDRRVISGGACERFLALSSDIFRYAEYASMIAFKHFSSKRLSAKDSDRGILREPKDRRATSTAKKSDGMDDGIGESLFRKKLMLQEFGRAIDD
jgi:hypothetical protein